MAFSLVTQLWFVFKGKIKAILRDVMRKEKCLLFTFFIIHLCNDLGCLRIISAQCIRAGYLV